LVDVDTCTYLVEYKLSIGYDEEGWSPGHMISRQNE